MYEKIAVVCSHKKDVVKGKKSIKMELGEREKKRKRERYEQIE